MPTEPFEIVEAVAAAQHGCVTRSQLLAGGLAAHTIKHLLERGALLPEAPPVYRVAGAPRTRLLRAMAVCLRAGPEAVLARRSAAVLHGLYDGSLRPPFELTVPYANSPEPDRRLARVMRSRRLREEDRTTVNRLPVTTVERLVFELAAQLETSREIRDLVSRAVVRGGSTFAGLYEQAQHVGALRHRGRVVGALARMDPQLEQVRSLAEAGFLRLCEEWGLPRPEAAHRPGGRPAHVEADFCFRRWCVWIEIDGDRVHATLDARVHDATRQNPLALDGWTVLRFPADLVRSNPRAVARQVAAALRAGGYEGSLPAA